MAETVEKPSYYRELDSSLYTIDKEPGQLSWWKKQTKINDDEELKRHIIEIQTEAYKIHPYPCIRMFGFLSGRSSRYRSYQEALKLGRERKNAIYLDLGCCFGTDIRHVISDGWAPENAITSDLHAEFWTLGHTLFRSTPESFPVQFVAGDIFSDELFSLQAEATPEPPTSLASLTSLTPLKGFVSVIHASSFFHLFTLPQQKIICQKFDALLSLEPGSMAYGGNLAAIEGEEGSREGTSPYRHSSTTWKKLWTETVGEGKFDLKSLVMSVPDGAGKMHLKRPSDSGLYWMVWMIKRI